MRHDVGIGSLQSEDLVRMDRLLDAFVRETGVRCAILMDRAGRLLTLAGDSRGLDSTSFASLAAADFSASGELANLLGEPEFNSLYHHGAKDSLYLTMVGGEGILAALFDRSTTLGLIRLQLRELAASFDALFRELGARRHEARTALDAAWADEAASALDLLFAD